MQLKIKVYLFKKIFRVVCLGVKIASGLEYLGSAFNWFYLKPAPKLTGLCSGWFFFRCDTLFKGLNAFYFGHFFPLVFNKLSLGMNTFGAKFYTKIFTLGSSGNLSSLTPGLSSARGYFSSEDFFLFNGLDFTQTKSWFSFFFFKLNFGSSII